MKRIYNQTRMLTPGHKIEDEASQDSLSADGQVSGDEQIL